MGWTGYKLEKGFKLFTRGGINGVYIGHDDDDKLEINIPDELLIMLAADTMRSERIRQLENMTDKEIMGLPESN